jgi:hypothetical protein
MGGEVIEASQHLLIHTVWATTALATVADESGVFMAFIRANPVGKVVATGRNGLRGLLTVLFCIPLHRQFRMGSSKVIEALQNLLTGAVRASGTLLAITDPSGELMAFCTHPHSGELTASRKSLRRLLHVARNVNPFGRKLGMGRCEVVNACD